MPSEALQALYQGDMERARELLGADDTLSAPEAAAFGRTSRLRQLLEEDPANANAWSDDGFSALHLAIYGGQEEATKLLIEHGADLNAPSRHSTMAGIYPIHTAVFVRSPKLVGVLLSAGADVNSREPGGETALMNAKQNGDEEIASMLRAHGAG
jgi:ankyrin repeat protein